MSQYNHEAKCISRQDSMYKYFGKVYNIYRATLRKPMEIKFN